MFYATRERDKTKLPNDPFKAIVAPRPIGWISTRALDGRVNLAPYSFFNGFCSVPPSGSVLTVGEVIAFHTLTRPVSAAAASTPQLTRCGRTMRASKSVFSLPRPKGDGDV